MVTLEDLLGGEELTKIEQSYLGLQKVQRGFNPAKTAKTAKILKGKNWQEKIKWIKQNYNTSNYTPGEIQKIMTKKDWKEQLEYQT